MEKEPEKEWRYITESLNSTHETDTTLQINYTSIF